MALLKVPNVIIRGISSCVPSLSEDVSSIPYFSLDEAAKFSQSTGVYRRRIGNSDTCTSDLCFSAAQKLLSDLEWDTHDVDCLVFVTQTPDYILPATSCILQDRLGLKQEVVALDISLGCSGWVYGLYVISSLLTQGNLQKGLLLVGDTSTKVCAKEDKSSYPLFGDAGTATAIQFDEESSGFNFHMACDGSSYRTIIIPDGGYRNQVNHDSLIIQEVEPGIWRNRLHSVMDGMNVFSFGITKAPESIRTLLAYSGKSIDGIDYFVFHQANLYMNEMIRKKTKLPAEKVPYSLSDFGNTSSASIPLTICTKLGQELSGSRKEILACGFGVGLSWASVYFTAEKMVISKLVEV